jgi:hypothetical protein
MRLDKCSLACLPTSALDGPGSAGVECGRRKNYTGVNRGHCPDGVSKACWLPEMGYMHIQSTRHAPAKQLRNCLSLRPGKRRS